MSHRALGLLGNRTFMDSCRANLYSCSAKPLAPHSGCRFMANRRPFGNLYMANQLVHYCLTPYLRKGQCGKSLRSCEYRFGESGGTPGGATAARQRFVSNDAKRDPKGTVLALFYGKALGKPGAKASRIEAAGGVGEESEPCMLAKALNGLVAYHHCGPACMRWLSSLRRRALECETEKLRELVLDVDVARFMGVHAE